LLHVAAPRTEVPDRESDPMKSAPTDDGGDAGPCRSKPRLGGPWTWTMDSMSLGRQDRWVLGCGRERKPCSLVQWDWRRL